MHLWNYIGTSVNEHVTSSSTENDSISIAQNPSVIGSVPQSPTLTTKIELGEGAKDEFDTEDEGKISDGIVTQPSQFNAIFPEDISLGTDIDGEAQEIALHFLLLPQGDVYTQENEVDNLDHKGPAELIYQVPEIVYELQATATSNLFGPFSEPTCPRPPENTVEKVVVQKLRDYVFNKLPIRLLCFEQRDSKFEIELLERGDILTRIKGEILSQLSKIHPSMTLFSTVSSTEEQLIERLLDYNTAYAILSHTWLHSTPGETTYGNWKAGIFNSDAKDPGYEKLVNFCKAAWIHHGLTLGWMDTVCINKESSAELDESIRSMYKWYERSTVCIVYLSETNLLSKMHFDSWFERGWTLQELLAPNVIKLYNQSWERFVDAKNDKKDPLIREKIIQATSLTLQELMDIHSRINPIPLSRKMQLAARRKVTREEDTAYCLIGLFNVSFATAYGEGVKRAFYRLLLEILSSTSQGVLDLFNWAGERNNISTSSLLPTHPRQYLARYLYLYPTDVIPIEPLTMTHMGLRIPVLLMPGISAGRPRGIIEPCGSYSASVSISPLKPFDNIHTTYSLLDRKVSGPDNIPYLTYLLGAELECQITFAVFNVTRSGRDIIIPSRCIAIPIRCEEDAGNVSSTGAYTRIYTKEPVVFNMLERNREQDDVSAKDYMVEVRRKVQIPMEDLMKHRMQLVFKYL